MTYYSFAGMRLPGPLVPRQLLDVLGTSRFRMFQSVAAGTLANRTLEIKEPPPSFPGEAS